MSKTKNKAKYIYPKGVSLESRKWTDNVINEAPRWCSVDLRDGNQALPVPMNPEKKLAYYKMLVDIGFKEIEVGFPSASQDDFDFVRKLIDEDLIPSDVRISVLTQARKHLIEKTIESLKGAKNSVIHCYVATSDLHGQIVFGNSREKIKQMAIDGTKMIIEAIDKIGMTGEIGYEFSPEEFTDTDIDFAIDICKAVKETWGQANKEDFILNLPATVERLPPYKYADMIEYFCDKYPYLDETTISIHAHNDQGCAVAASEMAILAGAERVEGTIFGHGERSGNVDLVTLAMNIFSRGLDSKLDFSDMNSIVKTVETVSQIDVHPRHPYAGQLVFTAFSGSHQDAIRKGIDRKEEASEMFGQGWKIPYLHIDPADVGRKYEKLIRINSQSGKGGVVYVLESEFGICPPKAMHPEIGLVVQNIVEETGKEMNSEELFNAFTDQFINILEKYKLMKFKRSDSYETDIDSIQIDLSMTIDGNEINLSGQGNGPISAATHALQSSDKVIDFILEDFSEQTLGKDANAKALAYVGIRRKSDNKLIYGAGTHSNIDRAAIKAIFSALNRALLV